MYTNNIYIFSELQNINKKVENNILDGAQKGWLNTYKIIFLCLLIIFIFSELRNINKKEVNKFSLHLYGDDDDDHDTILYDDENPEPCIPRSSSEDETIVVEGGIDN